MQQGDDSRKRTIRNYLVALGGMMVALVLGVTALAAAIDVSGAVIASGNLVVETELKKVQHPTGGVVSEILVSEGQRVEANDVVMRLDPTVARATLAAVTKDLRELSARKARLEAERDGKVEVTFDDQWLAPADDASLSTLLAGERKLFQFRTEALAGQKAQLRERILQLNDESKGLDRQLDAKRSEIGFVEQELQGLRELREKQLIPITRLITLEREAARLTGDFGRLEATLAQTRGKVSETELQIIQVDQSSRSEVAKELADIRAKTSELVEKRVTALDQSERIEIRTPQSGYVHKLSVHTIGGVIAAGEQLMQIVPEAELLSVEARILPKDIDQIRVDQSVMLRFSNFSQRTTPEVEGSVLRVSADVMRDERVEQAYYIVRIKLGSLSELTGLKLIPGMPVEAFIQTSKRTLMTYLTKPMMDQAKHAFRER